MPVIGRPYKNFTQPKFEHTKFVISPVCLVLLGAFNWELWRSIECGKLSSSIVGGKFGGKTYTG